MNPSTFLLSLALAAPNSSSTSGTSTSTSASVEAPARFALVIGSNAAPDRRTPALRFADDDAARVAELLRGAGVDVELVTDLDKDTQSVYGVQLAGLRPATRDGVLQAHGDLVRRMSAAKSAGSPVEYLIYYSGHGYFGPDGQVYFAMSERTRLARHEIFDDLLATSPADYNHLILDACQSEELVLSRGGSREGWRSDRVDDDGQATQRYLDKLQRDRFPNTGVLLASSADQQTHEWERYRGGIFTHELLSALRGAADVNGDGRLEYSEIGAFVSAANSGVKDPRGRLRVVARPPARDVRRPMLTHTLAQERLIVFAAGDAHRYSVEDNRGVRLADVHRSGELPGYLLLPPGEIFVYRERPTVGDDDGAPSQEAAQRPEEARVSAREDRSISASRLPFATAARGERGALDQALRGGLFSVPFGHSYYVGYTDRTGLLAVEADAWRGEEWHTVESIAEHEVVGPAPAPMSPSPIDPPEVEREDKFWNAISVGMVFSPIRQAASPSVATKRVTTDQGRAWAPPVRGLDIRYYAFEVDGGFPQLTGYMRTGFQRGSIDFTPADGATAFMPGQALRLDYFTVPLWLGADLHLFEHFPLRPLAGMGVGFDILHVDYAREAAPDRVNTSARIGFEVHAGLELRISNHFFASAQIQQQWAARKRLAGVPDLSTQGLSAIASIGFGFPHRGANEKLHRRRQKQAEERYAREQQAAADRARRAAEGWQERPLKPELLSPGPVDVGAEGSAAPAPEAPSAAPPNPPAVLP